jgi:phosphoribosyl 1,2-cyclic phosphate phosphodiesterase
MKVTVLGCGPSGGVPMIGNDWGSCDPREPRNRRSRVSVLVEGENQSLLIDTAPDLRQQMLDNQITNVTAVLYTHAHADHCHGIDDLRSISWLTKKAVDIYAASDTLNELEERFGYAFRGSRDKFYKPTVTPHLIEGDFCIGNVSIAPYFQNHGYVKSLGFRINDFAYSTDVKSMDSGAFDVLRGIKIWIVDCVREAPHPTHSHLEQTLEWIRIVKPERAYLTHMNHTMDYATIAAKLPPGVWPAYDGLAIEW